ncbi:MAG: ABC transporter permease [Oscillospiraceae bacterium]|nr:ABC transporter permease [Oscillospiraceae bacterium]
MFYKYFDGIRKNRYILTSLIQRDLQMKYRRSRLGIAWTILTPLGLAIIVGSVYSILFGTSPKELIPLIFASINPWIFMSGTADAATMAFPAAEGYIKQSTVTSQIFPIRVTMTNFVTLLYSVLTFFGVYLFLSPERFGLQMILCVPGLIIMFIFTLGLANLTSVVNLYIRDFAPFQSLVFQGLFYATPIIYDAKMIAEKGLGIVYEINPFYYMLEVVRLPMLGRELPGIMSYAISIGIALITFVAGVIVQMRAAKEISYLL